MINRDDRIQKLMNAEIIGNAFGDADTLNLAHAVLVDENESMDNKRQALHKIDEVMGECGGGYEEEDVIAYLEDHSG